MKRWYGALVVCLMALAPIAGSSSPAISIDVHDADIVDVLRLLGAQGRVNVVPDASLRHDRISLHLQNVTFEETINALARAYDLQVRKEGSVLLVGTGASMNRRFPDRDDGLGQPRAGIVFDRTRKRCAHHLSVQGDRKQ